MPFGVDYGESHWKLTQVSGLREDPATTQAVPHKMAAPQPITTMATYKDLVAQREALEAQIESARKAELSGAVSKVQELVAEFGLTEKDIFGGKSARGSNKATGSKVAAKYRDPSTGATWTGRGKPPRWIADQDRSKFAI